jgi:ribosomal protein S18 acetylase RimI-like enzyme
MLQLMEKEDYKELVSLWHRTEGMGLRSLDDSEAGIQKFIDRNPTTNFVYIEDTIIVGAIMCGHDGRRAYIYHAVVDLAYRGKGIGFALVKACEEAMRKEGINKISLVVYKSNQIGNGFWEKLGYGDRTDLNYRNKSLNNHNV